MVVYLVDACVCVRAHHSGITNAMQACVACPQPLLRELVRTWLYHFSGILMSTYEYVFWKFDWFHSIEIIIIKHKILLWRWGEARPQIPVDSTGCGHRLYHRIVGWLQLLNNQWWETYLQENTISPIPWYSNTPIIYSLFTTSSY